MADYGQLDLLALLGGQQTLVERFRRFDEANPHIYPLLVKLTRQYLEATGRDRCGIALVWERMRWELAVSTSEAPRLNNDYRAVYARLVMAREDDLRDVFEIRKSVVDGTAVVAA